MKCIKMKNIIISEDINYNETKTYNFKLMMVNDLINDEVINNLYHAKFIVS